MVSASGRAWDSPSICRAKPVASTIVIAESAVEIVCPDCLGGLSGEEQLACSGCARTFPIVAGIPIVLGRDSVFDPDDIASSRGTYFESRATLRPSRSRLARRLPGLGADRSMDEIDGLVNGLLVPRDRRYAGLVVGAGTRVSEYSDRFPEVDFLTSDVDLMFRPGVVADALALPVGDRSVDIVVSEHVIEHLIDPLRAAAEIERVLRPGGIVLVRMPFLFPWHGGYIDFFRATPSGIRVMFAGCDVEFIGHGMGPGAAAAYALYAGGVELFSDRRLRIGAAGLLRVLLAPLKWMDRLFTTRFGTLGGSAGITFVGRRAGERLGPRELLADARALGKHGMGPGGPASLSARTRQSVDPT